MMHISTIEQLQKRANVSFEEAREALEMTEWNLLDAYVWLEARGKLDSLPAESEPQEEKKEEKEETMENNAYEANANETRNASGFIHNLVRMFRENRLVARGSQGRIWSISLMALVLGVLFLRKFAFIAFVIALIMQVKFSFEGPDMKRKE